MHLLYGKGSEFLTGWRLSFVGTRLLTNTSSEKRLLANFTEKTKNKACIKSQDDREADPGVHH